jgi:hypothetical protein
VSRSHETWTYRDTGTKNTRAPLLSIITSCLLKFVSINLVSNIVDSSEQGGMATFRAYSQLEIGVYLECGLLAAYKDTGNNIGLRDLTYSLEQIDSARAN